MNIEELTARLDKLEGMVKGLLQIQGIEASRVVAPEEASSAPLAGTAPLLPPQEEPEDAPAGVIPGDNKAPVRQQSPPAPPQPPAVRQPPEPPAPPATIEPPAPPQSPAVREPPAPAPPAAIPQPASPVAPPAQAVPRLPSNEPPRPVEQSGPARNENVRQQGEPRPVTMPTAESPQPAEPQLAPSPPSSLPRSPSPAPPIPQAPPSPVPATDRHVPLVPPEPVPPSQPGRGTMRHIGPEVERPQYIEDHPELQPLGGNQPQSAPPQSAPPQETVRWTDSASAAVSSFTGAVAAAGQGVASGVQQGIGSVAKQITETPNVPRPAPQSITPDEARQRMQEPSKPLSPEDARQRAQERNDARQDEGSVEQQRDAGRQWQQYDRQQREASRTPNVNEQGQTRDERLASAGEQRKERAQQKQSERHDRMRDRGITPSVDRIKEPYRNQETGPAPSNEPPKIPPVESIASQRSGGDERGVYFAEQVASTMFLMNDRLTVAMQRIEELQLVLDAQGQQ